MPVTKKRGAIFAIYADSPVQSTSPTTASTARPGASPTKKSIPPVSLGKPLDKGKATNAGAVNNARSRRALGVVQARMTSAMLAASTFTSEDKKGKGKATGNDSDNLENSTAVNVLVKNRASVNPKPTTGLSLALPPSRSAKRLNEVLSSGPSSPVHSVFAGKTTTDPNDPFTASTTRNTGTGTGTTAITPTRTLRTPAKKPRPAPTTLTQRPRPSRTITDDSTGSNAGVGGGVGVEDKENDPSILDSPASRTRSKTTASASAAVAVSSATDARVVLGETGVKAKKGREKTTHKYKARAGFSVLMDASEAYGADGTEPEGFKVSCEMMSRRCTGV